MPGDIDEEIEAILQSMDLDGDGRVTAEEWVEGVLAMHKGAEAEEFVEDTKRMREYLEVPYLKEVCVKDASRVRVVHVEGYVAAANF
jgi:hypothetical protein